MNSRAPPRPGRTLTVPDAGIHETSRRAPKPKRNSGRGLWFLALGLRSSPKLWLKFRMTLHKHVHVSWRMFWRGGAWLGNANPVAVSTMAHRVQLLQLRSFRRAFSFFSTIILLLPLHLILAPHPCMSIADSPLDHPCICSIG